MDIKLALNLVGSKEYYSIKDETERTALLTVFSFAKEAESQLKRLRGDLYDVINKIQAVYYKAV